MPNIIWYIMLTVFSIIILVYTLIKQDTKRSFAIYFVISGMAYALDFLVLIIFHGYEYHPHVYKEMWWDFTLGSMISQGFAVPAIGTFIVMFRLKVIWYIVAVSVFMGIEELFLSLDIYTHIWWKTIYTGILLLLGFLFAKLWGAYLKQPSKLTHFFTIYCLALIVCNSLRFLLSSVFHTHLYYIGWFEDPIRDNIAFNALYIFIFSMVTVYVSVFLYRWYMVLTVILIDVFFFFLFEWIDILTLKSNWLIPLFVVMLGLLLWLYRNVSVSIFRKEAGT